MWGGKVGPGGFQVMAEKIRQRLSRFGQPFPMLPIHSEFNDLLFASHNVFVSFGGLNDYFARCTASVSARRTRFVATYLRYSTLAWTSPGGSISLTTSGAAAAIACPSGF